MPNFEVFARKNRRASVEPTITVTKRGTISLNQAAFDALGSPAAVQLLYDRETRTVGINPVRIDDPDSYSINKSSLMISAAAFTRWIGARTESSALRWSAEMQDGLLCASLAHNPVLVESNRQKKS